MNLWAAVNIGDQYKFQGPPTGGLGVAGITELNSAGALIAKWLPNVYIAAGIILFFLVLMGGFTMIMSAGNQEKLQQGRKTLTSAVAGFVILFASYWIIQIIQVVTGVPILRSGL